MDVACFGTAFTLECERRRFYAEEAGGAGLRHRQLFLDRTAVGSCRRQVDDDRARLPVAVVIGLGSEEQTVAAALHGQPVGVVGDDDGFVAAFNVHRLEAAHTVEPHAVRIEVDARRLLVGDEVFGHLGAVLQQHGDGEVALAHDTGGIRLGNHDGRQVHAAAVEPAVAGSVAVHLPDAVNLNARSGNDGQGLVATGSWEFQACRADVELSVVSRALLRHVDGALDDSLVTHCQFHSDGACA